MQSPGEQQNPDIEELNDDDLEYKPIVKYAAIGLGIVALLGVEYATYSLGFSRGFNEGVTSEVVSEAVNTAAVENLTHFMQAATADEATLMEAVRDRKNGLAWIKNPEVHREAEWMLAVALMNRGRVSAAGEMLRELFPRDAVTPLWGHRAMLVARAYAGEAALKPAAAYYRYSARCYGKLKRAKDQLKAYTELADLLSTAEMEPAKQLAELKKLREEVARLGEPGKLLQANLLACMGRIHRVNGDHDAALACFEQGLAQVELDKVPTLAGAAVSLGSVLLEKGDIERAGRLLREGLSRLGEHPGDADYLAAALRDLARIELETGNPDNALALLYRAEGAAMGRIEQNSPYWYFLYDQRGWIHFTRETWDSALADFNRALAAENMPEPHRVQPLEGAGRCCIALGRAEEAVAYLQDAVLMRERHFAADKPALGRVYLALAQAYDMVGKIREAADTYALAVNNLPVEQGEENDRFNALMGRAYALSQLKDWNNAIMVWQELLQNAKQGSARHREAQEQFDHCRRFGATLPGEEDAEESPETPEP
ncbi:MAG: tetratricopeptide repeat protein [Akkermansia sp.]|nr:tetratricopeptide repeat protein [Akkermansia sp.]